MLSGSHNIFRFWIQFQEGFDRIAEMQFQVFHRPHTLCCADAEKIKPSEEKLLFAGLRVRMSIATGKAERKLVRSV